MSEIFFAKPIVNYEIENLKKRVQKLETKPCLKVILVGNNPSSIIYVNNKLRFCKKINADCEIVKVDEKITKDSFIKLVREIAEDPIVSGLLVQLPVPEQLKDIEYSTLIPAEKDVDGFTQKNIFSLYNDKARKNIVSLIPCTPAGIVKMAQFYQISFEGKNVIILGRSLIVGKPLSLLLSNLNATVTLCHSKTKNLKAITRHADIIISATGQPNFLDADYFNESKNQIVFDVGISRLNGKIVGDVKFDQVKEKVKAITPVPGGIGPMTILSLANNLVTAAEHQQKMKEGN